MAHTQEELASYKHKAENLNSVFGVQSIKVAEEVISTLETLVRWDGNEFVAIELAYWYNVQSVLKIMHEL